MSSRGRALLFFAGVIPLMIILGAAMIRLPRAGNVESLYGDLIAGAVVDERHVTDVVSAINFDYRGIDTLGEELILFTSVMGVVLILRKTADERCDEEEGARREVPRTSDAVRVLGLAMVGVTITFGLYVVTHGQLTPGGGFQGGVIVATAWVLLYLAGDARIYQALTPNRVVEAIEAIGALAFALIGAAGMIAGGAFLENIVPLGPVGTVRSGGTIALLSVATGLAVAGGFVLMITAFVEEALEKRTEP